MAFKGLQLADTAFLGRAGNATNPASFPGLLRWYKADEYTPYASDMDTVGGGGATWGPWTDYANADNASGLGVFRTNQIGTQPLIFMTGTSFTFAPGALGDFTTVYVGIVPGGGADAFQFYNTVTGHQIRNQFFASHDMVFYAGGGVVTSTNLGATGSLEVLVTRRSAGVITFYQNKIARGGGADGNAWTVTSMGNSSGSPGTERFAEIMMYNTVLSNADLDLLYDQYLKPKWTTLP